MNLNKRRKKLRWMISNLMGEMINRRIATQIEFIVFWKKELPKPWEVLDQTIIIIIIDGWTIKKKSNILKLRFIFFRGFSINAMLWVFEMDLNPHEFESHWNILRFQTDKFIGFVLHFKCKHFSYWSIPACLCVGIVFTLLFTQESV